MRPTWNSSHFTPCCAWRHFIQLLLIQIEGMEHYDAELTETGKAQALAVNDQLVKGLLPALEGLDTLIVSPLRRALQTADLVFKGRLPQKILILPAAREIYWTMPSCRGHIGRYCVPSRRESTYTCISIY